MPQLNPTVLSFNFGEDDTISPAMSNESTRTDRSSCTSHSSGSATAAQGNAFPTSSSEARRVGWIQPTSGLTTSLSSSDLKGTSHFTRPRSRSPSTPIPPSHMATQQYWSRSDNRIVLPSHHVDSDPAPMHRQLGNNPHPIVWSSQPDTASHHKLVMNDGINANPPRSQAYISASQPSEVDLRIMEETSPPHHPLLHHTSVPASLGRSPPSEDRPVHGRRRSSGRFVRFADQQDDSSESNDHHLSPLVMPNLESRRLSSRSMPDLAVGQKRNRMSKNAAFTDNSADRRNSVPAMLPS